MIFSSNAVSPPATWYSGIIEHTEMVLNFFLIILLSFTLWKGKWDPANGSQSGWCQIQAADFPGHGHSGLSCCLWTMKLRCSNNHASSLSMRKENSPVPLLMTATTLTFTKLALSRNPWFGYLLAMHLALFILWSQAMEYSSYPLHLSYLTNLVSLSWTDNRVKFIYRTLFL